MSSLTLLSNLMLIFVLIISGIILLFTKTMPHSCNKPYRIAKRYIAYMWLLSSIPIIISLAVGAFSSEKTEILSTYSVTNFPIGSFLGIYIFLYLYDTLKIIRQRLIWLFSLPFFLVLLHCVIVISQGNLQVYSIEEYVNTIMDSPVLIIRTAIVGTTIVSILISVVQYFKVSKEHKSKLTHFSKNDEESYTQRISHMFYSIIPIMLLATLSYIINSIYFHLVYNSMLIFIVIFFTIKIINHQYLFHSGLSDIEIPEPENPEIAESKQEKPSDLSPTADIIKEQCEQKLLRTEIKRRMIHESIEKWISNEEKAYLKNGLTIQDVSLMTGIPKRRLADFIHLHYNLSFNSWINTLRVQEVERILSNKESCTMTLSEIAYKTGFSDLSNMSSTFKKIKGMNPSEYRLLVNQ